MKKRKYPVVNVGTSSVLTIFVILAMVTFAALTYMSARKDARFNEQKLQSAQEYQTAAALARKQIAAIDQTLQESWQNGSFESTLDTDYSFSVPCGDTRELKVTLIPCLPDENEGRLYKITCFKTVSTTEWEGESSLNLMDIE